VLPIIKKILPGVVLLLVMNCASAQKSEHFVSGSVTEQSLVEMQLMQVINNTSKRIAEYSISPHNRDFSFAINGDTGATYRLQVNLMKLEGRHPKLFKAFTLPLILNSSQNYTLNITPSKLNETKNAGWQLKEQRTASTAALISGKILSATARSGMPVSLHKVENGELIVHSTVQTTNNGDFEISCPVKKEGFYYLTTLRWKLRVYLKPADRLQVNVDSKSGKPVSLKGSAENEVLYQWQQLISPITDYGYNLNIVNTDSVDMDNYIHSCENLQPSITDFLSKTNKSNPQFAKALANAIEVDRQLAPIHFLFYKSQKKVTGWRPTPKDFNEVPAFYQQFIQPGKFSDASILKIGEARQFMNLYAKLNMALFVSESNRKLSQGDRLKRMMNTISNDTLKSLFFNDQMAQIEVNNLSEFRETFEPFKKYAKLSPAKETYSSIYSQFAGDTVYIGKSSHNFSLPDTSGNIVSMKDFKGKVVLIDVWATWCGPCKAQFPFLREIEEEYAANKDLVFVGVSVDKVEVKQKWQEMIRKEKLGGIQLLDDVGNAFANKYGIRAIPRFMLIDRQGRWIEIRCPRPELKEDLKNYLDKALAEQNTVIKSN
jgi:thiol-disulfide isomerase/thioredoxin